MAKKLKLSLAVLLILIGAAPAAATGTSAPEVLGSLAEQQNTNLTRFTLMFNQPIENLEKDDFLVTQGCSLAYLEISDATAQVDLVDCPSGLIQLTLLANSMGAGVMGPAVNVRFQVEIDATRPTARFSEIVVQGTGPFDYLTKLEFSEPVSFNLDHLVFTASKPCSTGHYTIPTGYQLQASCSYADLQWLLPAHSLVDAAGNTGPQTDLVIAVRNPAPPPTVSPTPPPTPTPTPVAPNPTPPPTAEPAPWFPPVMEPPAPTVVVPIPAISASDLVDIPMITEVPAYPQPMASLQPEPAELLLLPGLSTFHYLGGHETAAPEPEVSTQSASASLDNSFSAQVANQPNPSSVPVASSASISEPEQNPGLWLIGAGSLLLIAIGLLRRFSGR